VKRGPKDAAADVLEEVICNPKLAATRVVARAGVAYRFLTILSRNDLISFEKSGKRQRRLVLTDKGRQFLQHYRVCNELLRY
jgi:predicted transcriptional regulator